MNTFSKFQPNVFLAKCSEQHEAGDVITLETKYGKEVDCIVFNLVYEKDGFYYYSIVREDGFNAQEYAMRKAEKYNNSASNAVRKSNDFYKASNKHRDFLSLGEPIKVGHHSEKRHRRIIEQAHNNMGKSIEFSNLADDYNNKAAYWESRANVINLSMPESLEYYEYELQKAKEHHEGLKNGTIERRHSYSLTYAKKAVNDIEKKLNLATRLWG